MKNSVVVLRPKTQTYTGFVFVGMEDLENLIKFIGTAPVIKIEKGVTELHYKKQVVKPNVVVFRNDFGEVTNVLPVDKVEENYEVVQTLDFAPEYINKVKEKVKVIKEKEKGKK